jgi:type IV secretory pathway TrbL component
MLFPAFLMQLIIVLVIVALALWLLSMIPMDPVLARMIRIILIVGVCLWLLYLLSGFLGVAPTRR